MNNVPKYKLFSAIIICILALYFSIPSFLKEGSNSIFAKILPTTKVNLGLDLRGGAHLLLEIDEKTYFQDFLVSSFEQIKKEMSQLNITYQKIVINAPYSLVIEKVDRKKDNLKKIEVSSKKNLEGFNFKTKNEDIILTLDDDYIKQKKDKLLEQSIEIIRRRVDESGTKEPIIQRQGDKNILLQVPGLENPDHLKNVLGQTAKLGFYLVKELVPKDTKFAPYGNIILPGSEENLNANFMLGKNVLLSGEYLTDAVTTFDEYNVPVVSFTFNSAGAKKFAEITKRYKNKALAIVLDKKVISAPHINEPIIGGKGIIKGNFTVKTANDLALLLRAGALPAPLKITEERVVGPSLGSDSIEAGKKSAIIGIIAVIIFMILVYGILGVFANIALLFNIAFIISILAIIQATLTMPGIAGIVLTMGMAVDANVLIFERINEESKSKISALAAINRGFDQAFTTILDSNLTTIFAALALYIFGYGAVKGFAVTLIIGILTSMFSAIFLTKIMTLKWFSVNKSRVLKL